MTPQALIAQQITAFKRDELNTWNDMRNLYQGREFTRNGGDKESDKMRCSLNIMFAIVESAISSLLPRNPSVTCTLKEEADPKLTTAPELYVNNSFEQANYKYEQRLALTDAILCGRSNYKVTWDAEANWPCIRAIDPRMFQFDVTARRKSDLRYMFEITLLTQDEARQRVVSRKYKLPPGFPLENVKGQEYPSWLNETQTSTSGQPQQYKDLKNFAEWIVVYEFYDLVKQEVSHVCDLFEEPLLKTKMTYNPYVMLTLNYNGKDLRGLSEALLVKSNIQEINELMTNWLNIVHRQIDRTAFNANGIDVDQMNAWRKAGAGDLIPVTAQPGLPLDSLFAKLPVPSIPPDLPGYKAELMSNVSFVSALSDNARGQVSGARTATELALIKNELQSRLAARQAEIDGATEEVADICLFLASEYLKGTKSVKQKDSLEWAQVKRTDLSQIDVEFSVVPYSPLEENRAVIEERWEKALAYMSQHADQFNWEQINEDFVKIYKLNPNVLKPIEPPAPAPVEAAPVPAPVSPGGEPPMTEADIAAIQQQTGASPQSIAAEIRNSATGQPQ